MITEVSKAIWDFWSQFQLDGVSIPAIPAGAVPNGQTFPYITFETPRADAFGTMPLTAYGWFKPSDNNPATAAAQRFAWWEAVEKAIPHGGVTLPLSVGFLMLRRGSGDFLYPGNDEDDKSIFTGRVGYEVTYCTL